MRPQSIPWRLSRDADRIAAVSLQTNETVLITQREVSFWIVGSPDRVSTTWERESFRTSIRLDGSLLFNGFLSSVANPLGDYPVFVADDEKLVAYNIFQIWINRHDDAPVLLEPSPDDSELESTSDHTANRSVPTCALVHDYYGVGLFIKLPNEVFDTLLPLCHAKRAISIRVTGEHNCMATESSNAREAIVIDLYERLSFRVGTFNITHELSTKT